MESCGALKKKKRNLEQFEFVRSRRLGENCLSPYHFSAGCKQKKKCKVLGCNMRRKYLTSLHEPLIAFEQKRSQQSRSDGSQRSPGQKLDGGDEHWNQMQQERPSDRTIKSEGTR